MSDNDARGGAARVEVEKVELEQVEAGGFDWRLNRALRSDFEAMITDPDAFLAAADPRIIKTNPVRTVYFLRIGAHDYYVKRYDSDKPVELLKARFIESKASREWRIIKAGRDLGLPVPVPAVVGERWRGGRLEASYLATLAIPDTWPLVPYLEAFLMDDTAARHAFMRAVGAEVRRFHEAGFFHRDLHGGNLLVQRGADGVPVFHFIDHHRGSLCKRMGQRARRWNLAFMLHSTMQATDVADRRAAVEGYEAAGATPVFGDVAAVEAWVERRIGRFERRRLKSRTKRCIVRSSQFLNEPDGDGTLYVDRAFGMDDARAVLSAVRSGEGRLLKRTERTEVHEITAPGDRPVVAKTYLPRAYERFGRGRGLRAWRAAHGLRVRGVPSAQPLAFRAESNGGGVLITARAEGLRLDHHVIAAAERFGEGTAEFRVELERTGAAVAHLFATMHRRGAYHGDTKACNIFVAGEGVEARRLTVIDFDAVRFPDRPLEERRRVKNLAQLHAAIPTHVSRSERCRWFRRYATPEDWAARRRIFAAIAQACEVKIVVGREPIE